MKNIEERERRLVALRAGLARLDRSRPGRARAGLSSGDQGLLDRLDPRAVHDLYAGTPADAVALNAFGLGLAVRAAGGRPIVWAIHRLVETETGTPHGPGLHEMGVRPKDVLLVRAGDIQTLLAVGEEALRSPAVGAVLLSAWGEARAMTLTASRRLSLAAQAGTATLFLARAGAVMLAVPAAFTRPTGSAHWHVLLRARAIETGAVDPLDNPLKRAPHTLAAVTADTWDRSGALKPAVLSLMTASAWRPWRR